MKRNDWNVSGDLGTPVKGICVLASATKVGTSTTRMDIRLQHRPGGDDRIYWPLGHLSFEEVFQIGKGLRRGPVAFR